MVRLAAVHQYSPSGWIRTDARPPTQPVEHMGAQGNRRFYLYRHQPISQIDDHIDLVARGVPPVEKRSFKSLMDERLGQFRHDK